MPLAVLGSGRGGDCVPKNANYRLFYEACTAPAWQLVLEGAGAHEPCPSASKAAPVVERQAAWRRQMGCALWATPACYLLSQLAWAAGLKREADH